MTNEYDALIPSDTATAANEYDALIQQQQDLPRQQLRASILDARQTPPDAAARVKKLAAKTGAPEELVARNLPEVERSAQLNEYDGLLTTHPKLANALSDPSFARVAQDDVGALGGMEEILRVPTNLFRAGGAGARGIVTQGLGLARAVAENTPGALRMASPVGALAAPFLEEAFKKPVEWLVSETARQNKIIKDTRPNYEGMNLLERQFYQAYEALTQMSLVTPVGGLLSGGAATSQALIPMSLGAAGGEYSAQRDYGNSPQASVLPTAVTGVAEYLGEIGPWTRLASDLKLSTPLGKMLVRNALSEQVGEAFTQQVEDFTSWLTRNEGGTFADYLEARPSSFLTTALTTGFMSLMTAGPIASQQHAVRKELATRAQQHVETLQRLNIAVGDSALNTRDKEALAKYLDQVAEGSPVTDVYIDGRTLMQSKPELLKQLVEDSPSIAAQIDEAAKSGGDVRIPLGEYVTTVSALDVGGTLLPDIRTSPEGMSMREGQTFFQSEAEAYQKEVEKVLAEKQFDTAWQQSRDVVEQELLTQLREANRFTEDVNAKKAKLTSIFYATQAARLGITPEEFYVQHPLQIRAAELTGERVIDQPKGVFDASAHPPSVVNWAKNRWGNQTTPDGAPAWQNFVQWFGRSELVNGDGTPLVFYRGESSKENVTHYTADKTNERAVFFTSDKDIATIYANGGEPQSVFIKADKVLDLTADTMSTRKFIANWAKEFDEWVDRASGEDVDPVDEVMGGRLFDYEGNWSGERWKSLQDAALDDHDAAILPDWDNDKGMFPSIITRGGAQVKSTIGNTGLFNPEDANILRQKAPQAYIYSQLTRAIENTPDRIFNQPASELARWLKSNASKLSVKADEIYWSGIEDWLKLQGKNKVSKADVLAYLDENGVQTKDVVLGDTEASEELKNKFLASYTRVVRAGEKLASMDRRYLTHHEIADIKRLAKEANEGSVSAQKNIASLKLDKEQLAAVSEYREAIAERRALDEAKKNALPIIQPKHAFSNLVLPGGTNPRETVVTVPSAAPWGESDFTHYGDVGKGKQIAWIRTNDRTDAQGNDGRFIEEVQSQRAQKGKQEGFREKSNPDISVKRVGQWAPHDETGKWEMIVDGEQRGFTRADTESQAIQNALESHQGRQSNFVPPAPFITDANNKASTAYIAMTMKKAVLQAINDGKSFVAWTTGEQQADRYDLSKQLNEIHYNGSDIKAYDHDGNTVISQTGIHPKDLPDYIGKDAAEKLMEQEPKGTLRSLTGQDLKFGGEWTKTMYGDERGLDANGKPSLMAQAANDILKKLGGGKVESIDIGDGNGNVPGFYLTPEMIAKAKGEGLPLFQGARGQIQFGADTRTPTVITLLKNADLSTFLHELGHFQLEVLSDLAAQEDAPKEIVEDMNVLLRWFGVADLPTWRSMSLEQRRQYHEKFARGFEVYLFEGKAPSTELRGLFSRFRSWIIAVYKSGGLPKNELSPEVRGVMDRLVATNQEIIAEEEALGLNSLFNDQQQSVLTPEEQREHRQLDKDATQRAIDDLQARSLRDMQWGTNARSRELGKLQRDASAKRKAVTAEVRAEVRLQPLYAAIRFLKYGELPEGDKVTGAKLDLAALKEMYGEEPNAAWRYLPAGGHGIVGNEGLHPDIVAEMFGMSSGDELVRKILEAHPEREVVEGMTDQRMLERYGDLTTPEGIARAASEAVHNDLRIRFVVTEMNALDKALGNKRVLASAAKAFAANLIARQKVRDVSVSQYLAAETRAAKAAQAAMKANDLATAAAEKRNQVINMYAAKAAMETLDAIEAGANYLKRVSGSKTIDRGESEQIKAILARFDLRQVSNKEAARRSTLAQWVETQREQGFEPAIPQAVLDEAFRKPYREMTVEEFQGVIDTVKNIEHIGRRKHKLFTAMDARAFEERVAEAEATIRENAKKNIPVVLEPTQKSARAVHAAKQFSAIHRKFANMMREMDGWKDNGVLWNLFVRPMNRAGDVEVDMRTQASQELVRLLAPVLETGHLTNKMFIPEINASLTREGRIMVALNAGNEGNLQRLMDGDHWTPVQVRAVIDTLTKEEMDFVQSIWDFNESFRQQIGEQQKRLTGLEPEWIAPTPLETKHGTYRGGYIPAKYDATRSSRSLADEAAQGIMDQWRAKRGYPKARDSFVKGRADKVVDRPLRKDLGVITQHVTEVTHRLAWQEFLVDATRLLRAAPIDQAIRDHYGAEMLEELKDTIGDIATGEAPAENALERGVGWLRRGSTIVGLGWRLTTAMLQPFGLTQSMVRIGARHVGIGMAQWLGDAARMENTAKKIYAKSVFMRHRGDTMQREISEIRNIVRGENSAIEASYFYLIQRMQLVADIPTWLGQYEKSISLGLDEETAIAQADQAVIDAQGSGTIKDLAAVQRGSEWKRLFTNFYSFFNTTYNLSREVVGRTNFHDPISVGYMAVDFLLLYSVPAAMGTLMRAALSDGDDDRFLQQLIADQLTYLFGTMVGVRELAGAVQQAAGLPGSYSGPAGIRFFSEVGNLTKQISQGEVDEAALRAANNVSGFLFHYPAGQINATADGILSMYDGRTGNPGALIVGSKK